jgi:hypothetical protein
MDQRKRNWDQARGALIVLIAFGGGCADTEATDGTATPATNPEVCISGISWWGILEGSPETLVLQGCVNDECRTRTVEVDPTKYCKVQTEWTEDWGSGACASTPGPSLTEVVFRLDLTLVSNTLSPGDIGKFSIQNPDSGEMLYQHETAVDYVGGVDAGVACWNWNLHFDERTGEVETYQNTD